MSTLSVEPFEITLTDRRGRTLRADVFLPEGEGPFPTLLAASPYQKSLRRLPVHSVFAFVEYGPMQLYLDEGYAYVILDLPGSGRSSGNWDPVSIEEGNAIHDAIEYCARMPWSTGSIGMIGQSYFCWSQWNAARTRPPHLKTIVAYDGATDLYRDWMYHGGISAQGFLGTWLIGSVLLQHQAEGHDIRGGGRNEVMADILSHTLDDEWHRRRSPFWELDKVDIPVFSIGVWGKAGLHLRGNVMGYNKVSGPKQLLIAEPDSFKGAQVLFADESFHRDEILPWYDYHLKGTTNKVMERPNVRYYVNGAGRYDQATTWPPENVQASSFYLSSVRSGVVDSLNDGSLADAPVTVERDSTSWSYPDPQWVAGVTTFQNGVPNHTARITTFTTPVFDTEREFTGQGVLVLHASSDQTDLDLFIKVTVLPVLGQPGVPRKVTQGWLRASHRHEDPQLTRDIQPFHTHDRIDPLVPGEVYELRLELLPMSFVVKPGQRIRLEITNHDSALLDQPMTHWYGQKVGSDTYWHDAAFPSRLILQERPAD
ncbi:CocE/NonD family hydrolase [Pseudomonas prosekii]|uniref:CocE/NonD family hydrolase n=1 Tax=Pseudomonas prosekii TaxID=1148509 RepID=UPI0011EAD619|nr:CocE/NonD family hydrolase [Pseudomonas prosekii]